MFVCEPPLETEEEKQAFVVKFEKCVQYLVSNAKGTLLGSQDRGKSNPCSRCHRLKSFHCSVAEEDARGRLSRLIATAPTATGGAWWFSSSATGPWAAGMPGVSMRNFSLGRAHSAERLTVMHPSLLEGGMAGPLARGGGQDAARGAGQGAG